MNPPDFKTFFAEATKNREPYDYQCRLAAAPCESRLINIPTGLGKTAAVVLAWIYNRVIRKDPAWPRRLVYCLPMRTLVEQTEREVREWLGKRLWDEDPKKRAGKLGVHILMGGEDSGEWDLYPEEDAILIGTQDMLLSRALNRGYGMSRYRWPMHFGLLNNDALWVMDETQLMGVGVETSAQLDGFRCREEWRVHGTCPTWWMSATLDRTRLATVDHPSPSSGWPTLALSEQEKTSGRARDLYEAKKNVQSCSVTLNPGSKAGYAREMAALISSKHQPGSLSLVVVNRVARAREIYDALTTGKKPLFEASRVALIHSRFRPSDRKRHTDLLFGNGDRIVIATQAVEAGVDVSARTLITELAPWSSLVQRIGRCNRRGDMEDAQVLWVDIQPKDEKDELLLPYIKSELDLARAAIVEVADARPRILGGIVVPETPVIRPVIRRRDLVDLFDTTPDICGQDLDISRYIRDGEDSDVQFFWRALSSDEPSSEEAPPHREELCRVSIGDALKFLKKAPAWTWNPLEEKWEQVKKPRPGAVYLLNLEAGGYHDDLGWTGDPKHKPSAHPSANGKPESYAENRKTYIGAWQTIAEHTQLVAETTDTISDALTLDCKSILHTAAVWHDVGKAHPVFQEMLRSTDPTKLWAKSDGKGGECARPGFRHELASALAWLLAGPHDVPERDLVAFLIAAHHGKVRLSIRSLPEEQGDPQDTERLFARGIWQGDILPTVNLGELSTNPVPLDLSFMRMGEGPQGSSWLARTIAIRDRLGPFRLAFLETILRAADARASRLGFEANRK